MSSWEGDGEENPSAVWSSFDDLVWEEFGDCEDNAVSGGTLEDWATGMDRRKRARKNQDSEQNEEQNFQDSAKDARVEKWTVSGECPVHKNPPDDGNNYFSSEKEVGNESKEREAETSTLGWNMISNDHASASSVLREEEEDQQTSSSAAETQQWPSSTLIQALPGNPLPSEASGVAQECADEERLGKSEGSASVFAGNAGDSQRSSAMDGSQQVVMIEAGSSDSLLSAGDCLEKKEEILQDLEQMKATELPPLPKSPSPPSAGTPKAKNQSLAQVPPQPAKKQTRRRALKPTPPGPRPTPTLSTLPLPLPPLPLMPALGSPRCPPSLGGLPRQQQQIQSPVLYPVPGPGGRYMAPHAPHLQQSQPRFRGLFLQGGQGQAQYSMSNLGRSSVQQQLPVMGAQVPSQAGGMMTSPVSTVYSSQDHAGQVTAGGYSSQAGSIGPPAAQPQVPHQQPAGPIGGLYQQPKPRGPVPGQLSTMPATLPLPLPAQQHMGMGSPLTPQEKIEKLRWRQETRMVVEQRRQQPNQHLHARHLAGHHQAQQHLMIPVPSGGGLGEKLQGVLQGVHQGETPQGQSQLKMLPLPQFSFSANPGGVPITTQASPAPGQVFRQGVTLGQAVAAASTGQAGGTGPVEAAVMQQVEGTMGKLDMGTRLCIRDALYRLAHSSMQRKATETSAGLNASRMSQGSGGGVSAAAAMAEGPKRLQSRQQEKQQGSQSEVEAVSDMSASATPRLAGISAFIETETNPIDRNITYLLFHRPLLPSARAGNGQVTSSASAGFASRPQSQAGRASGSITSLEQRKGGSLQMLVPSPSHSAAFLQNHLQSDLPNVMMKGQGSETGWGWNPSLSGGSRGVSSGQSFVGMLPPVPFRMSLPARALGRSWQQSVGKRGGVGKGERRGGRGAPRAGKGSSSEAGSKGKKREGTGEAGEKGTKGRLCSRTDEGQTEGSASGTEGAGERVSADGMKPEAMGEGKESMCLAVETLRI